MASTVFVSEYLVAEAEPLIMESSSTPWAPPATVPVLTDPKFGNRDAPEARRRRACVKYFCYSHRAYQLAEALVPYGYPEDRLEDLALAVFCLSASEIDKKKYDAFLSAEIQSVVASLLGKSGLFTSMLNMFDSKVQSFNANYEFIDIAPDLRNGTTSTLDGVTALLDAAFGLIQQKVSYSE